MKRFRAGVLLAGILFTGAVLAAGPLESYEKSAPLEDTKESDVRINLGLARIDLLAGDKDELISISGEYNPVDSDPRLQVDRRGDRTVVTFKNQNDRRSYRHGNRNRDFKNEDRYRIRLSTIPLTDLSVDVGFGEYELNLDRLRLDNIELNSGFSEMRVSLDSPNKERASRVSIKSGLGELKTDHFGFLYFDRLKVEGGLGDLKLDLRGFEGDGVVDLNIGLGSCHITVPEDVDVRIYYSGNFLSSIDLNGFNKVSRTEYESKGFGNSKSTLEIDASVGMGNLTVERRR
ncbi:MAG: LiaF domain-containing protein [bacterium]